MDFNPGVPWTRGWWWWHQCGHTSFVSTDLNSVFTWSDVAWNAPLWITRHRLWRAGYCDRFVVEDEPYKTHDALLQIAFPIYLFVNNPSP
jgi:hypothetical protein